MLSGGHHSSEPGNLASLLDAPRLAWWPSEVDVSIRPGWFYHASEDLRVHSLERLIDIYYRSVGRNNVLLLNLPPDRRGLIHEHDVARLRELRRTLDDAFSTNLAAGCPVAASTSAPGHQPDYVTDDDPTTCWMAGPESTSSLPAAVLEFDLGRPVTFNRALLQEMIAVGQRIESYTLDAWHDGAWKEITRGTTVGHKKLDRFGAVTTQRVRLRITGARGLPTLRAFGLYRAGLGA
jgi:alpha-L-fucosidase